MGCSGGACECEQLFMCPQQAGMQPAGSVVQAQLLETRDLGTLCVCLRLHGLSPAGPGLQPLDGHVWACGPGMGRHVRECDGGTLCLCPRVVGVFPVRPGMQPLPRLTARALYRCLRPHRIP